MISVQIKLHSILKESKTVNHSNVIGTAWHTNISAYETLPLSVFVFNTALQ